MPRVFTLRYPTFTPATITGLSGWYDASVASSITGNPVSQWNDLSGNAFHLTSVGTGPATGSVTINTLNTLTFNASTGLRNLAISVTAGNVGTWFVVMKPFATTTNFGRVFTLNKTGVLDYDNANSIAAILRDGTQTKFTMYYNNVGLTGTTVAQSTAQVFTSQRNGDTYNLWVDGAANVTGSGLGTANFAFGELYMGVAPDTSSHWSGDIGEALWYNAALTTGDRRVVESYLKAKWGTA